MGVASRVKRFVVSPEALIDLGKRGQPRAVEVVKDHLPADATYLHATWDPVARAVYLFVESATFDEVLEGDSVPLLPSPVFRVVDAIGGSLDGAL